jgi:BirA family biotin operon repressor/biotin-[acetyl-CoA-carboxylase] ligase
MSIGLPVAGIAASRRGLATTCLALAVTDATAALGLSQVRIKWPNDLVVDAPDAPDDGPGYRKIGGILAELHPVEGIGDCLVLGIGLNVNWPEIPAELASSATSLRHLAGTEVDRDDLVAAILVALDRTWLPAIESGDGDLSAFWTAYAGRSATLGRRVRVELPGSVLLGEATAVSTEGALDVVDDTGQVHTVTVGDVVHLRPL